MRDAGTNVPPAEVAAAVADAHRREWGFVLAATARVTGDLDEAEEAVQDAYAKALETWPAAGIPASPGAWLTTTAKRRALDLKRRADVSRRALPKLADPDERAAASGSPLGSDDEDSPVADDRLRLIFTCCHPALAFDSRVALTLRMVCGLSTAEVARAFLVSEPTMAARITRAKRKISEAGIPYRLPAADDIGERIDGVLDVVHLVYATGHTAPTGAELIRRELSERGIELAELLRRLLPGDADVAGLLSLVYLTEARRAARTDADGAEILLDQQDRRRWDHLWIEHGLDLLAVATEAPRPGRFTLLAAIAAVHDCSPSWELTDWRRIVGLYDTLRAIWPSPVVELNRAIAIGFARGPEEAVPLLDALAAEPQLVRYPYVQAARADMLQRIGRLDAAALAYDEAIALCDNDRERERLQDKRAALESGLFGAF
ncbi:RNA polymerase sigma factor [Rathayibacter sp. KR2-224]|uniref:RNA polymerase sigma factor n=1 Tax=Rathayibacter sp. KR2-224 TaxID=3400913 RepID=UPI003C0A2C86